MTRPVFHWHSCSQTDRGRTRKINEDAFLDLPQEGLWIVADGMGGHLSGELASNAVINSCRNIKAAGNLSLFTEEVKQRLQETNQFLRTEATRRDAVAIGSTAVALLTSEGQFSCIWAGDSRLYLYRNGALKQLTRDHSLMEEFIREGLIPPDTRSHPTQNIITRSIGGQDELQLDSIIGELCHGDIFLACSDGLSKELTDQEIAAIIKENNLGQSCQKLIESALAHGAHDNVTVVLVQFEGDDKLLTQPG